MSPDAALTELEAQGDAQKAGEMAAYHKAARRYLGVSNPQIDDSVKGWRAALSVEERVALADALWGTDVHEARLASAKLLTQARLRPDEGAWAAIKGWVPEFDAWAVADHAAIAGQKRLVADPARLDEVEGWTASDHVWTRRAALVMTLPWAKMNNPKPAEMEARERILGWAAAYVEDREWFIQKAVAWWLRDLSKRAPERVADFLAAHGEAMKPFARKEAARYLPNSVSD